MSLVCPDGLEVMARMGVRARAERTPVDGGLSLTNRCNLTCVHCYARESTKARRPELTREQIARIVEEAAGEGCLFMLLTGGEPLVRPDFADIYRHVRETGMLVSLFTNGTLVDAETVALLKDIPPRHVDISVYGATPETYRLITGQADAYDRCRRGIALLMDAGITVKLKTVLMSHNEHEFLQIQELAEALGVEFRFDPAIFPRFDGDRSPIALRVPPERVRDLDLSDPERLPKWRRYHEKVKQSPVPQRLYSCGAGVASFHVDPYGYLQSCLMSTSVRYDLLQGSFSDGWRNEIPKLWEIPVPASYGCLKCDMRAACPTCPPMAQLETGDETGIVDYLCRLAKLRHECIITP